MNNRVTITFSRNFVAGDTISVYYSDPSTQTSGYWTFAWVSGTPGAFKVQVGTATSTTGEIEAINFASAWSNSLNGFTVTQPVGGNDNQVQITSQTYHFVNVLAKFADGSTMAIPTHYNYALSTVSTGNKITYTDKEPLNTPTAPDINLWKADDANEVKTKHNANDDRIGTLETDKADLVGGNDFTGDQAIDGNITLTQLINGILKLGDTTTPTLDFGSSNTTTGWGSANFGYNNTVSSSFGFAAGSEHSVTDYAGAALGYENTIGGIYGFAAVRNNNVRRDYSAALGVALLTDAYGCLVVGQSNTDITGESWYSTSLNASLMPVFVVGNGDIDGNGNSTSRSDALMVLKNGNVGIGVHATEKADINGNALVRGNIYERFAITNLSVSSTLSDTQRVLQYILASNGTLDIPDSLDNKVWEIFVTGTQLTVQPESGSSVTLSIVHNGQSNDGVISSKHSAKLIRTATNGYTLIKY